MIAESYAHEYTYEQPYRYLPEFKTVEKPTAPLSPSHSALPATNVPAQMIGLHARRSVRGDCRNGPPAELACDLRRKVRNILVWQVVTRLPMRGFINDLKTTQ
jgi:hypothetical protein